MSILIKSAKIFDANSKFNGKTLDILIINGKIKEISKSISDSKAKKIINGKKIKNLKIWLWVWYRISPPSVEYIEKELTTPNIRMQNNKI